jgi:hypothetical protein
MKYILILILLFLSASAWGQDYTYGRGSDEAEDSYIVTIGADTATNYYNGTLLRVYIADPQRFYRGFVKFLACNADIDGQSVDSAVLTLYQTSNFTTSVGAYQIRQTGSWEHDEVTYYNRKTTPGDSLWATAACDNTSTDRYAVAESSTALTATADNKWIVTGAVQDWADDTLVNEGFVMLGDTPSAFSLADFASADNATSGQRPYLEIWVASAGPIGPPNYLHGPDKPILHGPTRSVRHGP